MKIRKSYLAFILFTIFLFVFASCGSKNGKYQTSKNIIDTVSTSDNKVKNDENNEKDKFSKNILVWGILSDLKDDFLIDEFKNQREKALNDVLKNLGFNYEVKIAQFDYNDLENIKNNKKQLDILTVSDVYDNTYNEYVKISKNNYFEQLDSLLMSSKGNIIKKNLSSKDIDICKIDSKVYGLSTFVPSFFSTAYDKSALESINVSLRDLDPVLFNNKKILKKLKDKFNKPPIVTTIGSVQYTSGMYILDKTNFIGIGSDKKCHNIFDSKNYRNNMKELLSLHKDGLLEIGISENNTPLVSFPSQEIFTPNSFLVKSTWINPLFNDNKDVWVVPDPSRYILQFYRGDYKTGISSGSLNKDAAKDFLILLFTNSDVANTVQFGIKGKDYDINDGVLVEKKDSVLSKVMANNLTNRLITGSSIDMAPDKLEFQQKFTEKYAPWYPYGFRFDTTSVKKEIDACNKLLEYKDDPTTASVNVFQKINSLEVDDMDKEIDKFVSELKAAGIDKVIKEANRQLSEWSMKQNHVK